MQTIRAETKEEILRASAGESQRRATAGGVALQMEPRDRMTRCIGLRRGGRGRAPDGVCRALLVKLRREDSVVCAMIAWQKPIAIPLPVARWMEGNVMTTLSDMVLYFKPTCPYCQRVLSFMEDRGIEIELRNTMDPAMRAELVGIGGKPQVPCLVIDGKPLYESADIITHLGERM